MNLFALAADVAFGLIFVHEYVAHTLRHGRVIDFWNLCTLIAIVIPIIVVGPFADSPIHYLTIGEGAFGAAQEVDHAFAICAVGMLSWYLGAIFFRHVRRRDPASLPATVARAACALGRVFPPRHIFALLLVSNVSGLVIILLFGSSDRSLRDYMLENASIRPFFNFFIISLAPMAFVIAAAKFLDTRKTAYLIGTLFTALICIFSGARSIFFTPLIWLYLAHRAKHKGGKVLRLVLAGMALVLLALVISALRAGREIDDLWVLLSYGLLYGNSFSDFRDFCWYLSATHETPLYGGATYLAGLMSFVPTYLSPFREQFNLGVITATAVGLSPLEHAGIRITAFGELYINFGIAGVAFGAFAISWMLKVVDDAMTRFGTALSHLELVMCIQCAQVPLVFLSSNSIWSLYTFIGIGLIFVSIRFAFPTAYRRRPRPKRDNLPAMTPS